MPQHALRARSARDFVQHPSSGVKTLIGPPCGSAASRAAMRPTASMKPSRSGSCDRDCSSTVVAPASRNRRTVASISASDPVAANRRSPARFQRSNSASIRAAAPSPNSALTNTTTSCAPQRPASCRAAVIRSTAERVIPGVVPVVSTVPSATVPVIEIVRGPSPAASTGTRPSGGHSRRTRSRCTYLPSVVTSSPARSRWSAGTYSRISVSGDATRRADLAHPVEHAVPDAEAGAAREQPLDGRELHRGDRDVPERHRQDPDADAQPLGRGERGDQRRDAALLEAVLEDPQLLDARRLRSARRRTQPLGREARLEDHPHRCHGASVLRVAPRTSPGSGVPSAHAWCAVGRAVLRVRRGARAWRSARSPTRSRRRTSSRGRSRGRSSRGRRGARRPHDPPGGRPARAPGPPRRAVVVRRLSRHPTRWSPATRSRSSFDASSEPGDGV